MQEKSFDARLRWLASGDNAALITGGLRGLEKECLRVDRAGHLAVTPHSRRWGAALTHPWITTDYSEALLEFVTPPFSRNETSLTFLAELHAFVQQSSSDELLWPASMPCIVDADESVPIAQYGPSNEGRLRSIYRSGLGYRYGRAMQAIAGTHFNYSLPAAFWPALQDHTGSASDLKTLKSAALMGLTRNFRRVGWLLTYLFGASPAFCKSFRRNGHPRLESLNAGTWYAPYATSLRMSDMGYRNSTQARLVLSLNSLDEYLDGLRSALSSTEPRYAAIGVHVDGEYRQLNDKVLQLENEYYSGIRPKPASKSPRLIEALRTAGVAYVEVRTLDLNPFETIGISREQACLVELLLLYCQLEESPPLTDAERKAIDQRELLVAWEGRRPGLSLPRDGGSVSLSAWAEELLDALERLVPLIDDAEASYSAAVQAARMAARSPDATLSARVLDELGSGAQSFFDWALARAEQNRDAYLAHILPPGRLDELRLSVTESLATAAALESGSEPPFAEFLEDFLSRGLGASAADAM